MKRSSRNKKSQHKIKIIKEEEDGNSKLKNMNLWIKKFTGWTKPNGHDRGKSYMNLKIQQHKVFKVEEQRGKKIEKKKWTEPQRPVT